MHADATRTRVSAPGTTSGFTLIELMVTVAIVAILAAIAYPSYMNKVRQTRRSDGQTTLMDIMQAEQRHYTMVSPPTYTTDLGSLGYTVNGGAVTSAKGWYSITAAACGSGITSCVKLTAAPLNDQQNDTTCGTLIIYSSGKKIASGGGTGCW
ncbi:MAG: type IV pilin protein [Gammaproteobacteria bacterium]